VQGPTPAEREQVRVTNEYRLMMGGRRSPAGDVHPIRALRIHPQLVQAARGHSSDMATLGFFDHFNTRVPAKRTPDDRIKLAGYPMLGCSENIAQGQSTPDGAHGRWLRSSGHHRNLLTPGWVEMGSGQSGSFWTQNYGFRSDDDWEVPK
jgi:uncharacterized protein YkwD